MSQASITFDRVENSFAVGISNAPIDIHLPSESTPKPLSTVPFRRDPDFIDRGPLLDEIGQKLALPQARVALVGLGGVGKSQLAIEYVYRYREQHPDRWVLWIHTSSVTRFEESVRNLAEVAKIQGRNDPNRSLFHLVRAWLLDPQHGAWLVVLDNVDNVDVIEYQVQSGRLLDCIPVCDHGRVVITSRSKTAAKKLVEASEIMDVPPTEEQHALALLTRKLGNTVDISEAGKLAVALEYMPLAITQAIAYLRETAGRFSVKRYLDELQDIDHSRKGLLDYDNGDLRRDREASNSIILTWQLSFQHIARQRRSAAELLSLMSLCDREAIPETLMSSKEQVQSQRDEEFEYDIKMLIGFSFINRTADMSVFSMHRLVQHATRKWMKLQGSMKRRVEDFIDRLDRTFPWSDYDDSRICETLYAHTRSAMDLQEEASAKATQWAIVVSKGARFASRKGGRTMWMQAAEMGERCWAARKRLLGEEHPDTLTSMSNLAGYYNRLGDSKRAADMEERCWAARKKLLGEEHSNTLTSMSSLAGYYDRLGDSKRAAEMEERCWEGKKKLLGEEHPDTLTSMSNLAGYYDHLGDSRRAADIGQRCWATSKKLLGEEHPNTLTSMGNLAGYYDGLGDSKRAADMEERCWAARKKELGEDHPDTLTSMSSLAGYYDCLGDSKRAAEIGKRCWAVRKKLLGEDYPDTLTSMSNLAGYYYRLGDSKRAAEMGERCWAASKTLLGEDHPHTLISMNNLAEYYDGLGDSKRAAEMEERCWAARKTLLGEDHPHTLNSMSSLASYYDHLGD